MAFDGSRPVLYGGDFLSDTWAWDGGAWPVSLTSEPSQRANAAMAYDSARQRVVYFGGGTRDLRTAALEFPGDTWEWDGQAWSLRATSGPPGRQYAAMAYDAARQRTVLFGGRQSSTAGFVDTWEWDGAGWSQVATAGPSARDVPAMVYDTDLHRTVLFGGWLGTPGGNSSETWSWDGAAWALLNTTGPSARGDCGMAYDTARHRVVLFGGSPHGVCCGPLGDTWELDGASWSRRALTGPAARLGCSMAYDAARSRAVMFGGDPANGLYLNDAWEWDGTAWAQRAAAGPSLRMDAPMVYDQARGVCFVRGGRVSVSQTTFYDSGDQWTLGMVPAYANCDGSTAEPVLNVLDFQCFLNRFAAGDAYANCDGSTQAPALNVLDFVCFLNRFAAGCS
jgi:hypothetical protein